MEVRKGEMGQEDIGMTIKVTQIVVTPTSKVHISIGGISEKEIGIMEFTSIINQPNSAILSVGAIVERPVVKNGQIVVGNTMKISLACDHRTVDGATGAQFLQTLRTYLENPVTMLA